MQLHRFILSDLKKDENRAGILRIMTVEKSYQSYVQADRKLSYLNGAFACLQANGGCEELCVRKGSFEDELGSTVSSIAYLLITLLFSHSPESSKNFLNE